MTAVAWTGIVVACGAASVAGVEVVRRAALRHDVLDMPNDRSSHVQPTPRGGGLAVVGAVAGAWALAAGAEPAVRATAFPLAAFVIAAVSACDDVWSLRAGPRFAAHGVAAAGLLAAAGAWSTVALPVVGTLPVGAAGFALAALWVVGLTNAYNFMDGVDGIAGGQAVVAGTAWAAIGAGVGVPMVTLVGALVAVASAGFLAHNWPPARIFMGDIGAATLGFAFAAFPVVASATLPVATAARMPLAGLLVVWPFVFDAVYTVMRRFQRGENVLAAHRSHLYQRLARAGWTHRAISYTYISTSAFTAAAGVGWVLEPRSPLTTAAIISALVGTPVLLRVLVSRAEHRVAEVGIDDSGAG